MHEWESNNPNCICDWCYSKGYIIADETPFERYIKSLAGKEEEDE